MTATKPTRQKRSAEEARERRLPNRSTTRITLVFWSVLTLGIVIQDLVWQPGRTFLAWEGLVVFVLAMVFLGRATVDRFWSPVSMFLLVVGLFHLGLVGHMITGAEPTLIPQDWSWYNGPIGLLALKLVIYGIASYTLAALLVFSFSTPSDPEPKHERHQKLVRRFSTIGAFILIASVLLWFFDVATSSGLAALVGTYENFLALTSNSTNLNIPYAGMGIGLGFTLMGRLRFVGWLAIACFAGFVAVGFFLGLRGEVLFPVAAALPVLAARRRMPPTWIAIGGSLAVLALINMAKIVRSLGVSSALGRTSGSPLDALAELGSSLRVVAIVIKWHESGEAFYGGDTYTVAIARFFEQFSTLGRIPADSDYRLFNIEMGSREGPLGGSIIAEAYHNFDVVGVFIVMGIVGLIFGYLSRARRTPTSIAIYVAISAPLFVHIRNSFVGVLPSVLAGLVLILIVRMFTPIPKTSEGVSEHE